MIEIRLLGTISVHSADGAEVPALATSSKRLGVLAYLALHRPRGLQRRDALVAFFWPDSDEQRARGSLRSLLSSLRRELGAEAITARGEGVGLSDEHVWCDAVAFEDALKAGDLEAALALYGGPLLVGFHPGGSSELDQWLEDRRLELARRAVEAAWTLCDRAESEAGAAAAIGWARRAMALQPEDEPGLRRLMSLLDSVGDRASAVRAYETFARRLEAEYDMEPTPETAALVQALRERDGEVASTPATRLEGRPERRPDEGHLRATEGALPPMVPRSAAVASPHRRQWTSIRRGGVGLAVIVTIAGALTLLGRTVRGSVPLDVSRIAVFPFRVSGASSALAYLRQGMVDLLASDLTGRAGLRAVDPGLAVAAWQRAAREGRDTVLAAGSAAPVAARLGAGLVALGEVDGTPARLVLGVTLVDVRNRNVVTRARVTGPVDSLVALTDRLAGLLLAATAGEKGLPAEVLAATPLPALRDYLEGLQAYRRGRFDEAAGRLGAALDRDSTFTPAALALLMAASWGVDPAPLQRATRLAWAGAKRLSARDRALLAALAPAPGESQTAAERVRAWEAAVEANPDRAEAWYGLGDILLHWGALVGRIDARERAGAALRHSVSLRPGFAPPYDHVVELALDAGDTAAAHSRLLTFLAADAGAPTGDYLRWRLALAEHDSAALARLRARMDSISTASLIRIVGMGVLDGVGLEDVPRAAAALERRPGAPGTRAGWLQLLAAAALDEGRPAEADRLLRRYAEVETDPHDALRIMIRNALYSDGDVSSARAAYEALDRDLAAGADRALDTETLDRDRCVTEQWRVWHQDLKGLAGVVRDLGHPGSTGRTSYGIVADRECAVLIEAVAAVLRGAPDAAARLAAADSVRDTGGFAGVREYYAPVALARLHEHLGQDRAALDAVRRRPYHYWFTLGTLATALRIEGRLAERVGERTAAIAAFRRYLALRANAEEGLRPEVEAVRRRLAVLESGTAAGR